MRLRLLRRTLPLVLLLILIGMGLVFFVGHWQQAGTMRAEVPVGGCAGAPATLLVFAATRATHDTDKLSLDLPGPVMVAPTPCPTERP